MNTITLKINLYNKTVINPETNKEEHVCNAHYLTFNTELNRVEFYKKIFKEAHDFNTFETYNRNLDYWCTEDLTENFLSIITNKCGAILPKDGTFFNNFPKNMFFGFEEVESVKIDNVEL